MQTNFFSEPCKNAITILNVVIQSFALGSSVDMKSLPAFTGIKPKQVSFVLGNLTREGYLSFDRDNKLRPGKFLSESSLYHLVSLFDHGVHIGNQNLEVCPVAVCKPGFTIPNYEYKIQKVITDYLKTICLTDILALRGDPSFSVSEIPEIAVCGH